VAQVISLPNGGGAIKGLGEKFGPDPHTGTGNLSVPITVPPGRHGLQPDLTLTYSTGNGNGSFGLGWALSVPGVTRLTSKGVPTGDDTRDVFVLSGAEDLVPVPGGDANVQRYRPRTEGLFARIEHRRDDLTSLVDSPEDLSIRDEAFQVRLSTVVAETDSWWEAADAYESVDAVSLLTIHRSKGLEYHTVFVLGLDNDQWWSHRRETAASTSTFFVGLSRAAQRVIFTQCTQRGGHADIADLYAVLEQAGIAVHHFQ
jgi:hypothetical protein